MPYAWTEPTDAQPAELRLWPYRSLPPRGFVIFIGATAALLTIPLLAVLGTSVLWGLLPFIVAAVTGIWCALRRNTRDGALTEVLRLLPDRIELIRRSPDGREQHWHGNPYWVTVQLYPRGGPVPQYLTLKGNGREVELGAFLTEGERSLIAEDLRRRLARRHPA